MTRAMARWLRAPAPAQTVHAGMNYPYFVQWTGASGGYRRARAFDPGTTPSRCANCASSPPSAATWTAASRRRPPRSKACRAERGGTAPRPGLRDRDRAGRPPAARCACAGAPTATTRAAAAWKRSRPSAATRTRCHRTAGCCTGHSCRPTARCSAGPARCRKLHLALVYFDVASQTEVELRQVCAPTNWRTCSRSAARPSWPGRGRRPCTAAPGTQRCRPGVSAPGVPHWPACPGRGGLPHGGQPALPAGPGAHRHRQDRGHAVPAAAGHAAARHRQAGLPDLQGHRPAHGPGSAGRPARRHTPAGRCAC
jgi:hypothetical protein